MKHGDNQPSFPVVVLSYHRHQSGPTTQGRLDTVMTQRKLTVKGQGPGARVTFSLAAYRDKVWITSFDCPFVCEAILEIAQAGTLVALIIQTAGEARGYKRGPAS